jgi:short subunit dehydrogenase-like uncharacterized protein
MHSPKSSDPAHFAIRRYELVVFGASGFTGKRVAEQIAAYQKENVLKWAIAGRNRSLLLALKKELVAINPQVIVDVVIADVKDEQSLAKMTASTLLLLNLTGPFRFYGEAVVKSCLNTGTHYLDICGEPKFMEEMYLKYHKLARERELCLVSGCGFDSVPADMGTLFLQRYFAEKGGTCHSITSYLTLQSGPSGAHVHNTTWNCAVMGMGDVRALGRVRKQMEVVELHFEGKKPRVKPGPFWNKGIAPRGAYCMLFPGADASVVRMSQRHQTVDNAAYVATYYGAYFTVAQRSSLLYLFIFGFLFKTLCQYGWGRSLLMRFPRFFSAGLFSSRGPSATQLAETSFRMQFVAEGTLPTLAEGNSTVRGSVSGEEPGYVATPKVLLACARVLLNEGDAMHTGVLTPAAAFRDTSILETLTEGALSFAAELD